MRFSFDSALLVLALAHALVTPVSANEDSKPKRHAFKRASHGFHKSALRHSAGLARDLRVALRGLGSADTARAPIRARSNLGKKPYCVYNNGKRQTNSSANSDPFAHTGHTSSATSKPSASRSATTSPTSSSVPGQSNFQLAQSYVSNFQLVPCRYRPVWIGGKFLLIALFFHSAVRELFFFGVGLLHWRGSDQWNCPICRSADRGPCGPAIGPSCAL
jgi:hypothetical protein